MKVRQMHKWLILPTSRTIMMMISMPMRRHPLQRTMSLNQPAWEVRLRIVLRAALANGRTTVVLAERSKEVFLGQLSLRCIE